VPWLSTLSRPCSCCRVVMPNGEVVQDGLAGEGKSAAGYDLTRLMIGSEGTLGSSQRSRLAFRTSRASPRSPCAPSPQSGMQPRLPPTPCTAAFRCGEGGTPSLDENLPQTLLYASQWPSLVASLSFTPFNSHPLSPASALSPLALCLCPQPLPCSGGHFVSCVRVVFACCRSPAWSFWTK